MKLIIVSGLSGSGKTVALNTLEDQDYYCVDNLPIGLLPHFVTELRDRNVQPYENIAVGIDARSEPSDLKRFKEIIKLIREQNIDVEVIYLQAELKTLIKRFSDTRRKHPLTKKGMPLSEAIEVENVLLNDIKAEADLFVDTTLTNVHQLRDTIQNHVIKRNVGNLSILFQSFGFKHGTPTDSDFVFDVRCLPNPHWEPQLRPLTGLDPDVIDFLSRQDEVKQMLHYISDFLLTWIPRFELQNRYYLTISIGCTGGQHRSVYIAQELNNVFQDNERNVSIRHRELE